MLLRVRLGPTALVVNVLSLTHHGCRIFRTRLGPIALVIQCGWRIHLSRKRFADRKVVKKMSESSQHQSAAVRISRALKQNSMKMKRKKLSTRKDELMLQGLVSYGEDGGREVALDEDLIALKRWVRKSEARCFNRWKTRVLEARQKAESGVVTAKGLMHGAIYTRFRQWYKMTVATRGVIKPWRAKPGMKVECPLCLPLMSLPVFLHPPPAATRRTFFRERLKSLRHWSSGCASRWRAATTSSPHAQSCVVVAVYRYATLRYYYATNIRRQTSELRSSSSISLRNSALLLRY